MQTLQELEESIKKIQKESEDKINLLLKEYRVNEVNNGCDTIVRRLGEDERYYFINFTEDDFTDYHTEKYDHVDDRYHKNNNYFHTEEEAKKYAEHLVLSLKILRLRDKLNNECQQEWGECKYSILLDFDKNISYFQNIAFVERLQFKTEEIRENFRNLITDEEIIKFLSF